jgi:hypothetical protein
MTDPFPPDSIVYHAVRDFDYKGWGSFGFAVVVARYGVVGGLYSPTTPTPSFRHIEIL